MRLSKARYCVRRSFTGKSDGLWSFLTSSFCASFSTFTWAFNVKGFIGLDQPFLDFIEGFSGLASIYACVIIPIYYNFKSVSGNLLFAHYINA